MRRGWSSPAGAAGRPRGQSAHCAPAARGRRVGSGAPRQPRGSRPLPRAPGPALPVGVPVGVPLGRLNSALALLGAVPRGDPVPACTPAPRGLPGATATGPESGARGSCSLVGLGSPAPAGQKAAAFPQTKPNPALAASPSRWGRSRSCFCWQEGCGGIGCGERRGSPR